MMHDGRTACAFDLGEFGGHSRGGMFVTEICLFRLLFGVLDGMLFRMLFPETSAVAMEIPIQISQ